MIKAVTSSEVQERPDRMERIWHEFRKEYRRSNRLEKNVKEIFASVQDGQMEKVKLIQEVLINTILWYEDSDDLDIYKRMVGKLLDILGYEEPEGIETILRN